MLLGSQLHSHIGKQLRIHWDKCQVRSIAMWVASPRGNIGLIEEGLDLNSLNIRSSSYIHQINRKATVEMLW